MEWGIIVAALLVIPALVWLARRKEPNTQAMTMHIDLRLIERGRQELHGGVSITSRRKFTTLTRDDGASYEIEHELVDLDHGPVASLVVRAPSYKAAVVIGLHESDEWEEIALGNEGVLRYWCRTSNTRSVSGR